jgi:hypothetical protein
MDRQICVFDIFNFFSTIQYNINNVNRSWENENWQSIIFFCDKNQDTIDFPKSNTEHNVTSMVIMLNKRTSLSDWMQKPHSYINKKLP